MAQKSYTIEQVLIAFLIVALVFSTVPFGVASAATGINKQINFQGTLKDGSGNNVADGNFDIVFRIYTAASGGTPVATSTHTAANGNAITVTSGVFSVLLGSGSGNSLTNVDFNNDTLYLGVTVGTDSEMTPRQRMGAIGYAFNTDTLDGIDSSSFLRSDEPDTISSSSASTILTITQSGTGDILNLFDGGTEVFTVLDGGNVGIGTSTPSTALHVIGDITASGGLSFANATGTGNLQIATLNVTGQTTLASASSTNFEASGTLTVGGTTSLQGTTFTNATGTTLALTGLTAGSALFAGTGGIISQDNANLFWDDANNRLGIGTSTPAGTLHVANASAAAAFVVTSAGNVGIGTSTPSTKLTVLANGSGVNNTTPVFNVIDSNSSGLFTVIERGDVGIGTASPIIDLNIAESDSGDAAILMQNITTGYGANDGFFVGLDSSEAGFIYHFENNFIQFGTNDTERMIITAGGNIGIGTTQPSSTLHVIGDITASGGLSFVNATGTGNLQIVTLTSTGDSSLQGLTFTNATGTGNLQTATLVTTGQSTLASASSTNLEASGTLTISGITSLQALTFVNATGTGNLQAAGLTATTNGLTLSSSTPATTTFALYNQGGTLFFDGARIGRSASGTAGLIQFSDGSSGFDANNLFFWDNANGRLGIGTSTPFTALHVVGSTTLQNVVPETNFTYDLGNSSLRWGNLWAGTINVGSSTWSLSQDDSDTLLFTNVGSSTIPFTITQAGNVGIGTTNPDSRLQVTGGGLCVGSDANCNTDNNAEGVVYASSTAVTPFDVAEMYPTKDTTIESAEVVALDLDNGIFVKRATSDDKQLLGVISTEPAVLLGGFASTQFTEEHQVAVSLSGRVLVNVTTENGDIAIGDLLTISSLPGIARKADAGEQTIGYALENYDSTGTSTIQVFVNLERASSALAAAPVGGELQGNVSGNLDVENLQVVDATFEGSIIVRGHVTFNEDTVGRAKILAGDTTVRVTFGQPFDTAPIVTVTPRENLTGNFWVSDESTEGFTVSIAPQQPRDITFNWHAFGVDGGKIHVSNGLVYDVNIVVVDDVQTNADSTQTNADPSISDNDDDNNDDPAGDTSASDASGNENEVPPTDEPADENNADEGGSNSVTSDNEENSTQEISEATPDSESGTADAPAPAEDTPPQADSTDSLQAEPLLSEPVEPEPPVVEEEPVSEPAPPAEPLSDEPVELEPQPEPPAEEPPQTEPTPTPPPEEPPTEE